MAKPPPCVWNDFLPEPLATQVREEEPKRLAILIKALAETWQSSKTSSSSIRDAASQTMPFLPLVKALLDAKAEPDTAHAQLLAETLLDIVLLTPCDVAVQARWGGILHRVLKTQRRKLSLSLPWRPWYEMLRKQNLEPSTCLVGAGVKEARRQSLVHVVHRARRFFAPGSAAEIYAEFRHKLQDPAAFDAFEALGWLAMLMPTHAALHKDGDWGTWAKEWMPMWGSVMHSHYWQALWINLIARLAKHDVHGLVDWASLMPEIWNRFMWVFSVPVGTASASVPLASYAPGVFQAFFATDIGSRSAGVAKAAIYLIGRTLNGRATERKDQGMEDAAACAETDDAGLTSLEFASTMLEQYYHPSNGGKWTPALASFLKSATSHLADRLVAEHYAEEGCMTAASDDEGETDVEESGSDDEEGALGGGEDMGADDSSTDEEVGASPSGHNGDVLSSATARRHLQHAAVHRVVSALLKLAVKGQSSKDRTMRRVASTVLATLANICPDLVLPEVHRHFVTALATVTAARQYAGAIQTLSLCIRPFLIAGLPAESHDSETAGSFGAPVEESESRDNGKSLLHQRRVLAAQHVVDALMATLPCIDANDPPKTLATFRLYSSVLSSVRELPEDPSASPNALPLYTDAWAEELLARVFAIISNLDTPNSAAGEHSGDDALGEDDSDSFLLDGNSMFRPLMELLFVRLPVGLRASAIRRTSAFLLENVFSSVLGEGAILSNAIAWADPATTDEALLSPLLDMLMSDLESVLPESNSVMSTGHAKPPSSDKWRQKRLSKVQETTLKWRLALLSSVGFHMGTYLVRHSHALQHILGISVTAASQGVQEAASRAISSILVGLTSFYPKNQYEPCQICLVPASRSIRAESSAEEAAAPLQGTLDTSNDGEQHRLANSNIDTYYVAIECFIDKYGIGDGGRGLSWHCPNEDEKAVASAFLDRFLTGPARTLLSISASKSSLKPDPKDPDTKVTAHDQQGDEVMSSCDNGITSDVPLSKETFRSLLLQMEGALGGVRSCLPDFAACKSNTVRDPVGVIGCPGATVGTPELREFATKALVAALDAISPSDTETLALCLRVMDHSLSVGSDEYAESSESAAAWASDERWTGEPAVAGLLLDKMGDLSMKAMPSRNGGRISSQEKLEAMDYGVTSESVPSVLSKMEGNGGESSSGQKEVIGYGKKWRRRRPRWITAEKVFLGLQWRASQSSYRWYASASDPILQVEALPDTYLQALGAVVRMVVQGPAGTWESSAGILERAMKRYPSLAPPLFASLFAALAKIPDEIPFRPQRSIADVIPALQHAALAAAASAASAASTGGEAESEAEQAMVVGPAGLFASVSLWRLVSRDMKALRALCLALVGAAAHVGAKAQLTVTLIFLTLVFRYMPPSVQRNIREDLLNGEADYEDAEWEHVPDKEQNTLYVSDDICQDAMKVTHPLAKSLGSPVLPWRFLTGANSLPLLVIHNISPSTAASLVEHYLKQLADDVILTRQVAIAGINVMLQPLWYREVKSRRVEESCSELYPDPAICEAARRAVEGILENKRSLYLPGSPQGDEMKDGASEISSHAADDFASHLFSALSLSHPSLSADETQAARVLSMSRDNAYVRTVALSLTVNSDWPRTRERIGAVNAGHFIPAHARLVQVLCLAAPGHMLSVLRRPIEETLMKPQDEDRPAIAATAEMLAGILASGAPWDTSLQVTSYQTSEKGNREATAWHEWVASAFRKGLSQAPIDWAMDVWGNAALRYALFELNEAGKDDCINSILNEALNVSLFVQNHQSSDASLVAIASDGGDSNGEPVPAEGELATDSTNYNHSTSALYKQLCYASDAIQELGNASGSIRAPLSLRRFLSKCLDVLPVARKIEGELIRQASSMLLADIASVVLESCAATMSPCSKQWDLWCLESESTMKEVHVENSAEGHARGDNGSDSGQNVLILDPEAFSTTSLRIKVVRMLRSIAEEFEHATETLYEHSERATKRQKRENAMELLEGDGTMDKSNSERKIGDDTHYTSRKHRRTSSSNGLESSSSMDEEPVGQEELAMSIRDDDEGVMGEKSRDSLYDAKMMEVDGMEPNEGTESSDDWKWRKAIASVSFGVELADQLLGSDTASFTPWVVQMLPSLLRLQELVPSELQFVAIATKRALISAKYQRLEADDAMRALKVLEKGMNSTMWSERAVSLAFVQYFWFRHALVLGHAGTTLVVHAVEARLADEKLEVRELAATTLSGVIRGISEEDAAIIRKKFVARALELMPGRRRLRGMKDRNASKSDLVASIPERHGAALALKSLVLSSPYHVPSWLPDVLMALVRLSSEPPPVRTAVTSALAEFRRTHPEEEGGLFEVKEALTSEQWEAIRDASTNPASYFV